MHQSEGVHNGKQLAELTGGIDYLWGSVEEAGIVDRLVVIVGRDFLRKPYYDSVDAKDHWPIGSYIIMEKGALTLSGHE